MNKKKFIACIYLYRQHAVRGLTDTSIVDTDPVRLAKYYCENNADELIVFDMSEEAAANYCAEHPEGNVNPEAEHDKAHEEALDMIKDICAVSEVEVIGAGNIRRMEDVKKLLYAGCRKAILDYEKESNKKYGLFLSF